MTEERSKYNAHKARSILGKKAEGISDEALAEIYSKLQSTTVEAIEQYEKDTYGTTLKEFMEGTEKDRFLKVFKFYSDKFISSVPTTATTINTQWRILADDFMDFVASGEVPTEEDGKKL